MDISDNWPYLFSGMLGVTVATLITWGIYVRERHRKNVELIASSFPNVINFSYNFMEDGILRFRTLFETTVDEIAQSPELERMMQIAADSCAVDDAFFSEPEPEPDTCYNRLKRRIWPTVEWKQVLELLHLGILNTLSARYSEGHFGHALIGLTVPGTGARKHKNMTIVTENFCFGLTCEKNEAVRARKIRVMIAAKDFLKHQVNENEDPPEFERRGHWVRWETMCQMKRHMEREEAAAAMNQQICRKVWEVSLSFIVPRTPDDNTELQDQMMIVEDQLKLFDENIKSGRLFSATQSRGATSWRAGGENDDQEFFEKETSNTLQTGMMGKAFGRAESEKTSQPPSFTAEARRESEQVEVQTTGSTGLPTASKERRLSFGKTGSLRHDPAPSDLTYEPRASPFGGNVGAMRHIYKSAPAQASASVSMRNGLLSSSQKTH